jgi:hypothetical protein
MLKTSSQSRSGCCGAPGGGSGQKRAPGSRAWEGAAGTWPERNPRHDCGQRNLKDCIGSAPTAIRQATFPPTCETPGKRS